MFEPTPPPESGQLGRRFRILGTIGSGGFGTVYKAEMLGEGGFRKVFALKVLNPDVELLAEVAQRLRDEARILGLVRHRAIVQADSLLQLGGRWAVVMEYVQGVDLREVVSRGAIPLGPALEIVEEIALALHQAHIQPGPDGSPLCLLHRDIKPPNVQITSAGEVKVLDFGTARANFSKREAKTQDLSFGTIEYMSPERMEFEDTAAGDIYALGAVWFELLTATQFGRTSPIPRKHPPLLEKARAALAAQPAEVVELLLQCLAFEAADRPTAEALARACRRLRGKGQAEWLVEWSGARVPEWIAARGELGKDDLTGKLLTEYGPMPRPARDKTPVAAPSRSTSRTPSPASLAATILDEAPEPTPTTPRTSIPPGRSAGDGPSLPGGRPRVESASMSRSSTALLGGTLMVVLLVIGVLGLVTLLLLLAIGGGLFVG